MKFGIECEGLSGKVKVVYLVDLLLEVIGYKIL